MDPFLIGLIAVMMIVLSAVIYYAFVRPYQAGTVDKDPDNVTD